MNCPHCNVELETQLDWDNHVPFCAYRDREIKAEVEVEELVAFEPEINTGLDKMTVSELKKVASDLGLEFNSRIKSAGLIELIEGAIKEVE